jgi:drug/metabolite transporter (DMT)-like permease
MSRTSLARLGILALLWGSSFLFIRVGVEGVNLVQLVLARLGLGADPAGRRGLRRPSARPQATREAHSDHSGWSLGRVLTLARLVD